MTAPEAGTAPFLDLYGEDFRTDPHAVLGELRQQSWRATTPMGTAVLRYEEVQALVSMRELRTPGADFLAMQGITEGPLVETMRGFLLNADGEPHNRVRRLVNKAFTVRRVADFRPVVRAVAEELVDELTAREECDFVTDFADPFALRVLCRFVGIPQDVQTEVRQWTADVGLLFGFSVAEHSARIETALRNLHQFIDELLAEHRKAPRNDLLSALIAAEEAGELLTDAELRSMVITLMSAGHGTVQHQLGNAMAAFMTHPDQWRLLAAEPGRAAAAAEEVVRFCPSALLGLPRIAKTDIELNGTPFAAGTCVLPITGSANRDASVFEAADTLDISRERTAHLTYGGGIHYCLGAALARLELQEALPLLANRLLDPSPAGPDEWLPPTEAVYGPVRLPIRYRPEAARP
jgi:cytochrome P450